MFNPNIKMADAIDHYDKIALLDNINGVPLAEIEKRARPGDFSQSGFIGQNESFKSVLQQDWRTVYALGITHIELANHLKAIWKRVEKNSKGVPYYFSYQASLFSKKSAQISDKSVQASNSSKVKTVSIQNDNKKLFFALGVIFGVCAVIGATINTSFMLLGAIPALGCMAYALKLYLESKGHPSKPGKQLINLPQNLEGVFEQTKGYQEDLFSKDIVWSSEIKLTNTKNKVSINVAAGVIDYIKKYGFYEGGGDKNIYRIDPLKLVAILTGYSIKKLQSRVDNFYRNFKCPLEMPIPVRNGPDLTLNMSNDARGLVLSFLNLQDLLKSQSVSKAWKTPELKKYLNKFVPKNAFGKSEWDKIGDIGNIPPLPENIHEIMHRPCPFFPGKMIKETHMLVLIPQTLDGEKLTLNYVLKNKKMTKLFDKYSEPGVLDKFGSTTSYGYEIIKKFDLEKVTDQTTSSHWTLMTYEPITKKPLAVSKLQQIINDAAKSSHLNYELPCVRDLAICLTVNKSMVRNYFKNLGIRQHRLKTVCQEKLYRDSRDGLGRAASYLEIEWKIFNPSILLPKGFGETCEYKPPLKWQINLSDISFDKGDWHATPMVRFNNHTGK